VAESEAPSDPEPEMPSQPDAEITPADAAETVAVAASEVHPSEAMLAELDGVQPEQVQRPTEGGDDLTAITGIGPRIAEVLNELGIWTYAQIAGWQPEHETWIENHLAFKGRVSREDWVGQASALAQGEAVPG
jgi:NADH-quinone oxidoreductase subunit E